jgi:hypothetical protein
LNDINFFLSEHYENDLIKKISYKSLNYVVHGIFLTKINSDKNFKSIYNNFSRTELNKIYNYKNKINYKQIKDYNKISDSRLFNNCSSSALFALNRLFFFHNFSSIDLIFFIKKNYTDLQNANVKFFVGENYRLTEVFTILFWFIILKKVSKKFEVVWLGRNKIEYYKNNYDIFLNEKIFTKVNNVKIFFNHKNKIKKKKNVLWLEGLRDRNYWINKLDPLIFLKNKMHYSNSVMFSSQDKISFEFKENFFKIDNKINLNNILNTKNPNYIVSQFYEDFVLEVLKKSFKDSEKKLLKIINVKKIRHFYTPSAPLLESIMLQNLMLKHNIETTLLPHSFTPSHEFHPKSYKIQYCKIRSKNFMPSAYWLSLSNKKEQIVNIKEKNDIIKINFFLKIRNFFKKLNSFYSIRRAVYQIFYFINYFYQKKIMIKTEKTTDNNFLVFLNVEIYEMLLLQDFNNLYKILSRLFFFCESKNLKLIIRRKPNWTNFYILKKFISNSNKFKNFKNLFILNDYHSIKDVCALSNFVIFTQPTSAILEVIKNNKPVFFLKNDMLKEFNEPYIKINKNIVPEISFDNFDLLFNKEYLIKVHRKQQIFYNQQKKYC